MLGDPSSSQYQSRISTRTDMKLLLIIAAILAVAFSEDEVESKILEDSQAEAAVNIELLKQGTDLKREASAYNTYVPNQKNWNNNYVDAKPIQPVNTWQQPSNNYYNPQNNYPQNNYPQNNYPQNNYPQNNYPQNNYPQNNYNQNKYPQNNFPQAPVHDAPNTWNTEPTTTTTQKTVIKNEQWYGDNGAYNYEYKLSDGTSVGEQGFYKGEEQKEENVVKKGWYSYPGADGKVYTVTWWADESGFHAEGDHLPTPPPVPPAIQAALDKQEAEKKKPQNDYYPTSAPSYYPTPAPTYYPTPAPTYYPTPAPTYYPTAAPAQYYPTQAPQQQYYPNQQHTYYPNQQNTYPNGK